MLRAHSSRSPPPGHSSSAPQHPYTRQLWRRCRGSPGSAWRRPLHDSASTPRARRRHQDLARRPDLRRPQGDRRHSRRLVWPGKRQGARAGGRIRLRQDHLRPGDHRGFSRRPRARSAFAAGTSRPSTGERRDWPIARAVQMVFQDPFSASSIRPTPCGTISPARSALHGHANGDTDATGPAHRQALGRARSRPRRSANILTSSRAANASASTSPARSRSSRAAHRRRADLDARRVDPPAILDLMRRLKNDRGSPALHHP